MFEVVILQDTLKTALEYLSPTVGKNSGNLGDDCISLEATNVGSCILYTTNTIESTLIELICSNATQPAKAPYVNFKRFKGIIDSIPSGDYVTIKEGINQLLISYSMKKPIVINANTSGMILPPPIIDNPPVQMTDVSTTFLRTVVNNAASIINDSPVQQILNCVKVSTDNSSITAEAIDVKSKRTFFMSEVFGGGMGTPETFLIEASKMNKSLKLFQGYTDVEIGQDNSSILITSGNNKNHIGVIENFWYVLRKFNGAFPNVSQYYTPQYEPTEYVTLDKNDIIRTIARIKALGDETSFGTGITITADKNEFKLSFNSAHGQLEESIDVIKGINGSFNMKFNHEEFENILKNIPSDYVDIGLMQQTNGNFIIKGASSNGVYSGTDKYTMLSKAMPVNTP